MLTNINYLTDQNWVQNLPSLTKVPIRVSSIKQVQSTIKVEDLALKFVLNGRESYSLDKKTYTVEDNQYILVRKHQTCEVTINEQVPSKGVCVDLNENILNQVTSSIVDPNGLENETDYSNLLFDILGNKQQRSSQHLTKKLQKVFISSQLECQPILINDVLYEISKSLVEDHLSIISGYFAMKSVREATRKENFKRIQTVRDLLCDSVNTGEPDMKQIARQALLSEFRMYHLFKDCFGCSPYQFFLNKKIEKARALKQCGELNWTEISHKLGFSDIAAFSKTFKKITGFPPSKWAEQVKHVGIALATDAEY